MPEVALANNQVREAYTLHRERWIGCQKCRIGAIARHHCFFRGLLPCHVLFIGEGPGKTEDLLGLPFVGRAGRLLDVWLNATLAPSKRTLEGRPFRWAITNLVLCRPCEGLTAPNRAPAPVEVRNCQGRLMEFIHDLARPRAVVLLGRTTEDYAPQFDVPMLAVPHPAWVCRRGGWDTDESRVVVAKLNTFLQETFNGYHR